MIDAMRRANVLVQEEGAWVLAQAADNPASNTNVGTVVTPKRRAIAALASRSSGAPSSSRCTRIAI